MLGVALPFGLATPTFIIEPFKTGGCLYPKFSKNYPTLFEKFKNQVDFAKNGKKLLDFLLHALYN